MPSPQQKYQSKVYQIFKEIGEQEYQTIVRFFEEHEQDIQLLTFEEYFELLFSYTNALFEVGAYSNYIDTCDFAIESSIQFNVKDFNGEDIYRKLLFRKAASYYHLMQYDEAEHILQELIRMKPKDKLAIRFLKKCKIARQPGFVQSTRAASVLLFIIAAVVIAFEQFYIKPFLSEHTVTIMLTRNIIFGLGWLVLIGGDLTMRYKVGQRIDEQVNTIRKDKKLSN